MDVKWNVTNWRGTVGVIAPSTRVGAQDVADSLPEGVGVLMRFLDARRGTADEFTAVRDDIERNIADLVAAGADVIAQNGVPPMIVHGHAGERDLVRRWESTYGVPVVTAVWSHVEGLRAMGVRRFVGLTYLDDDMNRRAADYFTDAGFEVVAMEGIGAFAHAHHIPAAQVYASAKALFLQHEPVDGIYLLGGAWQAGAVVEPLEQDLQVPVIGGRGTGSWALQHRLRVRQPLPGMGRLLAEFPALPAPPG